MVIQGTWLCAVHGQLVANVTSTEAAPPSLENVAFVGAIEAGGFDAVKLADAELLPLAGSLVAAVTDTTLAIDAPLVTVQLTDAVIVTVADAPAAIEANETMRLLPVPPQTPPPVAVQLTKETAAGRLSVSVIDCAVSAPLLVTVIV